MDEWELKAVTITIGPEPCKHDNGSYVRVPKRLWGYKTMFLCIDCATLVELKKKL
jgi:hypothetical protein